jgi:hypothetical protein
MAFAYALAIGLALAATPDPAATPPAPAPSALSGEAMYVRAIETFRALAQPAYVVYRVDYRGHGAFVRCVKGQSRVDFAGGEQRSTYRVWFKTAGAQALRLDLETNQRCAGAPLLSPSGGDIAALVRSARSPSTSSQEQGGPPVIGEMRVESALYYKVTAMRDEDVEGHATHHLSLQAFSDAPQHPLTELWLDVDTFLVRRVTGDFSDRYSGAPARTDRVQRAHAPGRDACDVSDRWIRVHVSRGTTRERGFHGSIRRPGAFALKD